jgi:SAM-dependent methyltransferase
MPHDTSKKSAAITRASPVAYGQDLAYIHDVGFGAFARSSAAGLLELLPKATGQLVIDLGCGSGLWAQTLTSAGYQVLGIDISPAMIELARQRAPAADFREGSFLTTEFPRCIAVTAIGEVLNYLFDRQNTARRLHGLFRRVYRALSPGGVLVFDGAEPGRVPPAGTRNYSAGEDWACFFSAREDRQRRTLTREIISFRKVGSSYRRDAETHRLRLFDRRVVLAQLRGLGFRARMLKGYGQFVFPAGYAGFLARKPER